MKYCIVMTPVMAAVSHPARGAWIEMLIAAGTVLAVVVAPRKGCVD